MARNQWSFWIVILLLLASCGDEEPRPCSDDGECWIGEFCEEGYCSYDCQTDHDCQNYQTCDKYNGKCLNNPSIVPKYDAGVTPDTTQPPSMVTISIRSAVIAPFKSTGEEWDWTLWKKSATGSMIQALANAMAKLDPYGAVKVLIESGIFNSLSKPDPMGVAVAYAKGGFSKAINLATSSTNQEDTFTPIWPGGPGWSQVPFGPDTRVSMDLYDEDIYNHDPIGSCEITYKDLYEAWKTKKVVQVNVSSQTYNQALFVGVTVY